jgi:ADP-ribose pyrophosphatase
MRKLLILGLCCFQCIYGGSSLDQYFAYVQQLDKSKGSHLKGEIEIITNLDGISRVETLQKNRLQQKGLSEAEAEQFSRVGVVFEDQYLVMLRDAVYFPKGIPGTYDRLIWKSGLKGAYAGVAVLPVLSSGRIVLNLNYRHATRSWELEVPRGGLMAKESVEEAALREAKEETGCVVSSVTFLGDMAPDTGIIANIVPVFIGKVAQQENSSPEYSEAIAEIIAFTKDELKEGLRHGFLEVSLQGEKKRVPLRDSFLTFALFQAELRGLL